MAKRLTYTAQHRAVFFATAAICRAALSHFQLLSSISKIAMQQCIWWLKNFHRAQL
jgi:hypothetical protein